MKMDEGFLKIEQLKFLKMFKAIIIIYPPEIPAAVFIVSPTF